MHVQCTYCLYNVHNMHYVIHIFVYVSLFNALLLFNIIINFNNIYIINIYIYIYIYILSKMTKFQQNMQIILLIAYSSMVKTNNTNSGAVTGRNQETAYMCRIL